MPKIVKYQVLDIKFTFDIRCQMNQDHVLHLALLYLEGVKIDPIEVTEDGTLVDGRHRLAAAKEAELKEIECVVVKGGTQADLHFAAVKANFGGKQPMTAQDMELAVEKLLDLGRSNREIIEGLAPYPASAIRQFFRNVQSKQAKRSLRAAQNSVLAGATIVAAAREHDVDEDRLKELMGAGKIHREKFTANQDLMALKRRFTIINQQNAKMYQRLEDAFREGHVTAMVVKKVLEVHQDMLGVQQMRLNNWAERLRAEINRIEKKAS